VTNQRGNPPACAALGRDTTLYSVAPCETHHDAVIRVVSEVPRRRPHSTQRRLKPLPRSEYRHLGSSSAARHVNAVGDAMDTVNVLRHGWRPQDETFGDFTCPHQAPQGDEQLAGERHNHSFSRLGAAVGCPGLEPLHQRAVLLNLSIRQANWIMPVRSRAKPALASPFSRRLDAFVRGARKTAQARHTSKTRL